MEKLVRLCSFDELVEGIGRLFCINEKEIAVFREGNRIFAFSNVCPHNHVHKLFKGFLKNSQITCPVHHYTYCAVTGSPKKSAVGSLKIYKVHVQNNNVFVKIDSDHFNFKF
ncbi:MAG: Rieske (2Fe-2S) protein [Ignavibacteria bacterium]